jgi:hypothetical protein
VCRKLQSPARRREGPSGEKHADSVPPTAFPERRTAYGSAGGTPGTRSERTYRVVPGQNKHPRGPRASAAPGRRGLGDPSEVDDESRQNAQHEPDPSQQQTGRHRTLARPPSYEGSRCEGCARGPPRVRHRARGDGGRSSHSTGALTANRTGPDSGAEGGHGRGVLPPRRAYGAVSCALEGHQLVLRRRALTGRWGGAGTTGRHIAGLLPALLGRTVREGMSEPEVLVGS